MRTITLLFVLLLGSSGCQKSAQTPGSASTPPAPKTASPKPVASAGKALGAPCQGTDECMAGAHCTDGACEYPGPCSVRTRFSDGKQGLRTLVYDERGYLIEQRERAGGQPASHQQTTWSKDHRRAVIEMTWDPGGERPTTRRSVAEYDARGRIATYYDIAPASAPEEGMFAVFDWSKASCGGPPPARFFHSPAQTRPVGRRDVRCEGGWAVEDRSYRVDEAGDEHLWRVRRIGYDSEGRFSDVRVSQYGEGSAPVFQTHQRYVRDARGVTTGLIFLDPTDDKVSQRTETWDLSCWAVVEGRVVAQEEAPAAAHGALAKSIRGRWRWSGRDREVLFEPARGTVSLVEHGDIEELPARVVSESNETLVIEVTRAGRKDRLTIRRVDARSLTLLMPDGQQALLTR